MRKIEFLCTTLSENVQILSVTLSSNYGYSFSTLDYVPCICNNNNVHTAHTGRDFWEYFTVRCAFYWNKQNYPKKVSIWSTPREKFRDLVWNSVSKLWLTTLTAPPTWEIRYTNFVLHDAPNGCILAFGRFPNIQRYVVVEVLQIGASHSVQWWKHRNNSTEVDRCDERGDITLL